MLVARTIVAALTLLALTSFAQAGHRTHHAGWHGPTHSAHVGGRECSDAIGGGRLLPCGCWAQHRLLGIYTRLVNGLNYYRAETWARFPRTSPHAGAAALFAHRGHIYHVAPVESSDGTRVVLNDSWGRHAVAISRIAFFVEPR